MAASEIAIANRALQELGATTIESFEQDHPNARSMKTAYAPLRDKLLRRYTWNFAIKRASVAADAVETLWGGLNRFLKPNDFIRLLRDTDTGAGQSNIRRDWQIEGKYIITSEGAPLEFRYLAQITDPSVFDPAFDEMLALAIAHAACKQVTGSNSLKDRLREDAAEALAAARQSNAFENDADVLLEDDWLLVRL